MNFHSHANKCESAVGRNLDAGHHEEIDVKPGILRITIPYTTPELTGAALRYAGNYSDLNVKVLLVDLQVVPYPCAIDRPPLNRDYSLCRLRQLLDESGLQGDSLVLYARDWLAGFERAIDPGTLSIIATKSRWWQTREKRLARALSAAGHDILLLPIAR